MRQNWFSAIGLSQGGSVQKPTHSPQHAHKHTFKHASKTRELRRKFDCISIRTLGTWVGGAVRRVVVACSLRCAPSTGKTVRGRHCARPFAPQCATVRSVNAFLLLLLLLPMPPASTHIVPRTYTQVLRTSHTCLYTNKYLSYL